jgi:hypothetical protein
MPRTEVARPTMTSPASGLVPRPRPAPERSPSVPFLLPWQAGRPRCCPVIGDALLMQYPGVAKALAEGQPQRGGRQVPGSAATAGGGTG